MHDDFEHLIFHDVIPIKNIDYRPRNYNVAWFMSAGTCKLEQSRLTEARTATIRTSSVGEEDKEFDYRRGVLNFDVERHRSGRGEGCRNGEPEVAYDV